MPVILAALFFVTAIAYAAVGFGGGSTYTALLVLNGTDYRIVPSLALACNIIVVTGGVLRFWQAGTLPIARMLPFLAASIPAAWIGGRLPIGEAVFTGLLGAALFISGLNLALRSGVGEAIGERADIPVPVALIAGGSIGLLSGVVGIGGGIFLAPILYYLKWGHPREIAAGCSLFILLNSLSGLTGQVAKLQDTPLLGLLVSYWPLLIAVFIGGQIGSWLATKGMPGIWVKRLTSVLIVYVATRLLYRFWQIFDWTGAGI